MNLSHICKISCKNKSKSQILETIFAEVDEQLSLIPDFDWDGSTIQDSMHFDMYVDTIADVHFTDGLNRKHYPFNKVATILLEDELECRQLTKEENYAVNKNNKPD